VKNTKFIKHAGYLRIIKDTSNTNSGLILSTHRSEKCCF